jgi:hypothetical protein
MLTRTTVLINCGDPSGMVLPFSIHIVIMNRAIKIVNKLNRRKSRKSRKSKTVINVNTPPPLPPKPLRYQPKNKKKKKTIPRPMSQSRDVLQYRMSLLNPFDQRCNGVRVPDAGSFSTVAFHYRSEATVQTGSNVAGSFAYLPSPFLTCWNDTNFTNLNSAVTQFASNATYCYYVSPGSLLYSTMRVVSGGINISCQLPELYATGRLIISPVPLSGNPIAWATMNLVAAVSQSAPLSILTGGITPSSGLLAYPSAYKISLLDLLRKPLLIPFQIENPTLAYQFKSCNSQGTVWNSIQNLIEPGEVFTVSNGQVSSASTSGSDTQLNFSGWDAIFFYMEGVPLSGTFTGSILSIESILHCEGCPLPSGGAYNAADARPLPGSTSILEAAVDAANKILDNTTKRVFDAGMQSVMQGLSGMRLGSSSSRSFGYLMNGE